MRDGQGNKLSSEEEAKVKSAIVKPTDKSLGTVSVDPEAGDKARSRSGDPTGKAKTAPEV